MKACDEVAMLDSGTVSTDAEGDFPASNVAISSTARSREATHGSSSAEPLESACRTALLRPAGSRRGRISGHPPAARPGRGLGGEGLRLRLLHQGRSVRGPAT